MHVAWCVCVRQYVSEFMLAEHEPDDSQVAVMLASQGKKVGLLDVDLCGI